MCVYYIYGKKIKQEIIMFEYLSCLFVTFFGVRCVLYEKTETLITLLVRPAFGPELITIWWPVAIYLLIIT